MLRSKGLTEKLLLLGIDGMDPRFTKRLVNEGKLPNVQKLIERGACRDDLMMLGANPTITPPMWATLATGAYPMTHGIIDFNLVAEKDHDITLEGFSSRFLKAEPIWNITAQAGKKTLVMHWPGGSFPPIIDSENLYMIDGSSPGACCSISSGRGGDAVFIADAKAAKPSYYPYSIVTTDIAGDATLSFHGPSMHRGTTPEAKERLKKYQEDYLKFIDIEGYQLAQTAVGDALLFEEDGPTMWMLADFPSDGSISPISEPTDWGFEVPVGAKEFITIMYWGKITRPALILQNEQGKYDRVAIYADKNTPKPLRILGNDVFEANIYDMLPRQDGTLEKVHRNMRALQIAEDGSRVVIWSSRAMSCEDDSVWFPKSLFKELTTLFGPPVPTSQMSGNDADLILKCNNEQWKLAAKWQSDIMHYMIEKHGVEVICSHMHNIDLQGHNYMKYMKNRDTSRYDENEVVKFAEATYKITDDYLGTFMHLLDEGWTILLFSDHALVSAEEHGNIAIGDSSSVCVDPLRKMGYTVLKQDENGKELPEVDWTKTRAIQVHSNSIFLNVKGRDPYGIVDPVDKYELEEQIITDLYSYKDAKTGKRIIALALHNKDAILLGLGGPYGADITIFLHESFVEDHGPGLSTAYGHNDTSLSPIFIAAGKGIKKNYRTERYIREVDLAPTASVLLGVDIPAQCEGAPAYQIFSEKI